MPAAAANIMRLAATKKNRNIMKCRKLLQLGTMATILTINAASALEPIHFSGYTWVVRAPSHAGPGPNYWDPNNAYVDTNGGLHLRLSEKDGKWLCPELITQKRLGFGRYEFSIIGPLDKLDQNVVFGFFNYPTPDVGVDGTHEIDIEFARWGNSTAPIGNYTVWPAAKSVKRDTKSFPLSLSDQISTHSFVWSPTNIVFLSREGAGEATGRKLAGWQYAPLEPAVHISQKPMPVHFNLWCFQGRPPANGQPVELVVRSFKFTPL